MKHPTNNPGFSLVEVTLALGILAFAFIAIFGMLPVGLQTFRNSADTTQTTQIAQKLLSEAQQTPFDRLDSLYNSLRYFDDEGNELATASSDSLSGPTGYVYSAVLEAVTDEVETDNHSTAGISKDRTQIILIKIAKNQLANALPENVKPLAQFTFAVADVQL